MIYYDLKNTFACTEYMRKYEEMNVNECKSQVSTCVYFCETYICKWQMWVNAAITSVDHTKDKTMITHEPMCIMA